jgi:D-serine deaminase-like pyridoxal phosphate-dependent protein
MDDRQRYDAATATLQPPFAIVDLAAFRRNAADLTRRAAGKPIRVASKSVRCRALLTEVLRIPGFSGIMAFTLPEALWLARTDTSDDILVAYPTTDTAALAQLAAEPAVARAITVMVDTAEHLDIIEKAVAGTPDPQPVRVCIDLDTGFRALRGLLRAGARRSPVRTPAQAAELARNIAGRGSVTLAGLMAYEAQIAGVGDNPAGRPVYARVVRAMQRRSGAELAVRRAAIVAAVREVAPLEFVNGGGTGSVEKTAAEDAVTEIGAGSGLYQPTLFDSYRAFRGAPAALFALPVVRRPGPGVVTALGGGYVASGPASASRLPRPVLPAGLRLDKDEGAGEVQTPLLGPPAAELRIGDRVWLRHAKAGELCEHFAQLHLVEGERVTATVPTYRGEGKTFL